MKWIPGQGDQRTTLWDYVWSVVSWPLMALLRLALRILHIQAEVDEQELSNGKRLVVISFCFKDHMLMQLTRVYDEQGNLIENT